MEFKKCKPIVITSLVTSLVFSAITFSVNSKEIDIYTAAINHKQRLQKDLKYDEKRNPKEILPFTQLKTGDKVLELGAGGGYTTELISWTIGNTGKLYVHFLYNQDRLKGGRLANVVSLQEHSLNEHKKVLEENKISNNELDAIIIFFVLHDIYLNNEMSDELLATLYESLKPGGRLIILDNAAKPDSGLAHIGKLHRIDEHFVKSEVVKAGFVFDKSTDVLRNENDDRTKPWGDFKGLQDRFALSFNKPSK